MKEKASSVKLPCDPHIGAGAKKLRERGSFFLSRAATAPNTVKTGMLNRQNRRRLAIALRAVGLALIAFSLSGALLHSGLGSALAQVMPVPGLGTPVPEGTQTPSPSPGPSASPSGAPKPSATPKPEIATGGPLRFSLTGSLTFGERGQSSIRGDGSSPNGLTMYSQNQGAENAGLMMQVERRTGSTTLSLGLPLGVTNGAPATWGQMQAGYYTSHFGLQYMPQPLALLGAAPLGTTLPGFSLLLPLRGGDLSLYEGRTFVDADQALTRVYGVRARELAGHNLYELGAIHALRADGGATINTLLAGFASTSDGLNQLFEGAWQDRRDAAGSHHASAVQYRLDYGGESIYSTITARHVGSGFTTFGGGQLNGDDQVSGTFHAGPVDIQEIVDRTTSEGEVTKSRQGSLSIFHQFGSRTPVAAVWNLTDQRSDNSQGIVWLGSAGMQLGIDLGQLSTLFQVQGSRSTSSSAGTLAGITYQALLQRQIGSYVATAQFMRTRQLTDSSTSKTQQSLFSIGRQWGVTSLTLTDAFTHTVTPSSDAIQNAPLLTLSRKLSPVLALGLSYGVQNTHDSINPSANGRSRLFNIQLTAPFSIGNGIVQGRANPKLPATISGMVINDTGNAGPVAANITNGVGNVMVVLDGQQVQRTDLSGRFQFNFVTPGHHTVQLQLASLPRGVTPDEPIASADVQGGQQANVIFQIGTYGAVQGHVYGRDAGGDIVPMQGVVLTIDTTGGISTTGPDGMYGFGRLAAGTHTIAVQTASLPAMAALSADETTQKITVRTGQISTLDFTAAPLGSIGGFVLYESSLAPKHKGGVFNAYVVAEPGDYAAITSEDGSFLLDNLPAGTYTLDLDPETLPNDTGNAGGSQTVKLDPGGQVQGISFHVGIAQKSVVFTLKQVATTAISADLQESQLPPAGATEISVDGVTGAKAVVAAAFGKSFDLAYDKSRNKWVGTIDVPLSAKAGTVDVNVATKGGSNASTTTQLTVDPHIPIARFTMRPRHPARGEYVTVQARFLADVRPGDEIHWLDGQVTKLSYPLTGRVYEFTVKISIQPLTGSLLTRQGELPITLR
jgi:hypothetical protein